MGEERTNFEAVKDLRTSEGLDVGRTEKVAFRPGF
jgi:hypothetical protein